MSDVRLRVSWFMPCCGILYHTVAGAASFDKHNVEYVFAHVSPCDISATNFLSTRKILLDNNQREYM